MRLLRFRNVWYMCVLFGLIFSVYFLQLNFTHKVYLTNLDLDVKLQSMESNECSLSGQDDCQDDLYMGVDNATYYRGDEIPDDVLSMKKPRFLKNYKNPCWYEKRTGPETNRTLRCLPYFHVIGVDKCGTTDFWNRLTKHPEIVSPKATLNKETHWWSWRRFGFDIWVNDKRIQHFESYLQHFDRPAKEIEKNLHQNISGFHHLITGEGSPTVFWDFTGWDKIPQNFNRTAETAFTTPDCIKHLTPKAKFIAIFRNPTTRLYSDYIFLDNFKSYHNISVQNFHQDVLKSIEMFEECLTQHSELFCLYSKQIHMNIPVRLFVGMYDVFLNTWLKVFPKDQVLLFRNEDYSSNIRVYLQKTFDFLGLTPLSDNELDRLESLPRMYETKRVKDLGPMLNITKDILDQFYSKYNQQLARRLQDSRFLWLT